MTGVLDDFGLTRMVPLLHATGQSDRIHWLFESDWWLMKHLGDRELGWSGYASDLSLAFDSLAQDIKAGKARAGETVLRLSRLCLVRSALAAATDIPEGVLLGALRTGAWQDKRVTSTIERYADRGRQASACVSMLSTGLDASGRTAVQRTLASLAFVRPDDVPAAELLRGVPFLNAPDQRAVADRLALCPMAPHGPSALWQRRARGGGGVLDATDVVTTMVAVPETRRPALVRKTVDTLLEEAIRISRNAMVEYQDPLRSASSLNDVMAADLTESTYGDYVARPQVLSSLVAVASFLSAYPDPGRLPSAFADCMGCAASAEEWAKFSAACAAGLHEAGVHWQPSVHRQAARYTSPFWPRDQDRLWWQQQLQSKMGNRREVHIPQDEDPIGWPTLGAARHGWVQRALAVLNRSDSPSAHADTVVEEPHVPEVSPRRVDAPEPETEREAAPGPEAESLLMDVVKRGTAPIVAVMVVAASGAPPEMIDGLMPEAFDDEYLTLQLLNLANAAADAQVPPELARRAMGGLLRHALESAHLARGAAGAWADVDAELIVAADLTPVLDFVLGLPTEPERDHASPLFESYDVRVQDVPMLTVLEAIAEHLDKTSAVRVTDALLAVPSTPVRNRGLDLMAPRLPREVVERVLALNWRPADAREQVWALREIAAGCSSDGADVRKLIEGMALEAADGIEDGWAYVDTLLHTNDGEPSSAAATVARPEVLATVRRLSVNNRADALRGLSHHADRDTIVPAAVLEEILKLPGMNASGTYSWRGTALVACAGLLDASMAGAALDSAMELPERFTTGSSQAWGHDWTTEFLRAAVVNALVPAMAPSDARRAFDYARTLPYIAREPVFRTLAETADPPLASLLFDHTVERYQTYLLLEDSPPPSVIEQALCMDTTAMFQMHRQVQTAEIIAAIVDRLNGERRAVAAEMAMGFSATGPCAWLGAAILKHLAEDDHVDAALLTGMALVDAYSYVASDPARIDLLIDLLPHTERHAAAEQAALTRFVASRFPDFEELFLDEAHGRLLEADEQSEYIRLTGMDRLPRQGEDEHDPTEAELRARAAMWILSPIAHRQRDEFLKALLLESPVTSRVRALSRLSEVLPEELHGTVLTESIQELVRHAHLLGDDDLAELAKVVEHLPTSDRGLFLPLVTELPAFDATSAEEVEAEALEEIYHDWGRILRPHPKYADIGRSVAAQELGNRFQRERFRKSYHFVTPRVRFLAALAPHLSQGDITDALHILRDFPEAERASGLVALLPMFAKGNARLVRAEIDALESRFARLWVLWQGQGNLGGMGIDVTARAEAVIASFETPTAKGAAALLMVGHLGVNRAFDIILEQARRAGDDDRLKLMSLAVRIGQETGHRERLSCLVMQLSSPEAQFQAMLMFGRSGMHLHDCVGAGGESAVALLSAVHRRFSELSRLPPVRFLRALAGEMAVVNGFLDDSERLMLARSIRQVFNQWRWP
ncbi:hypothetical protein G9272_43125 [Streptomyces asoensis]|uniref:Uncharacterized protein n=1 Tax=Streptomyces asoensis TaxID=249586 RepID=A0A6M4X369_9ACTN|nr:hypothetical protein [Streptomyces asoensis]QJT06271.1 hypothetical protein G9272_43125 [Streptomyces asoensis]